ncbi:HEAT repeat domain-containing protein, partial [Aphanizomenon sp. CS-733/32]|uniref:HEAT repeat domain-containing protein n=1 Tax=Aphanizomenon sp. CS-733/32 TaxID=3021715 RepID=UPI00232C7B28
MTKSLDELRESMVKILGSDEKTVGSGFIIRNDGYIVTCHHVIYILENPLKVEYQDNIYDAEWDENFSNLEVDIAILKINIESAKAVKIINPKNLSTSVTVYGFPNKHNQNENFPKGVAVYGNSIRPSAPLNVISTYIKHPKTTNHPWNKKPLETSTFLSHRIDAKVEAGSSGGAVFSEKLGGVLGIIQCSKSDESYVIRWDNILDKLDQLGLEPKKNIIKSFLEEIESSFQNIKLFHSTEPITIKDQYIPIQVTLERKYNHTIETTWSYSESEEESKRAYALKHSEESKPTQVDWQEAKQKHQRLMVLADPGMGKTTLLKSEAYLTAQTALQGLENNSQNLEDLVIPIFLRLSEIADTTQDGTAKVSDAILKLLASKYENHFPQIESFLTDKLKAGKYLLLLDALDEVPKESRNNLSEKLNSFLRNYNCPIIFTSRIVGYSGAFLGGAKDVEIVPFNEPQINQYIVTWFKIAAEYINDDSISAAALIRELQTKPQIRGLVQNPLLLSLICSLYQEKGINLPARRCEVYEQAVKFMLTKWRKTHNPEVEDAWINVKIELLEELAYQFSCNNQEIFTMRELRKAIDSYLKKDDIPSDFNNITSSPLITELSEQDGILQKLHENGDQHLFLHRTFQEYFTACYLQRSSNGIELAKAHFWDYEWHEIFSLMAGLMKNPVTLLQTIKNEKDDIFQTLLLLAGRCTAEVQRSDDQLVQKIIKDIHNFFLSYPHNAEFITSVVVILGQNHLQMVSHLQADLNHADKYVRSSAAFALGKIGSDKAVDALITALNHAESDVRSRAAEALGKIGSDKAVDALITALNDAEWYVRSIAAEALGKIGSDKAVDALITALNDAERYVRS